MIGTLNYSGIAQLLTGAGVLVAAIAGAVVSLRSVHTIKATHAIVKEVDRAVNGKPPGGTTLVSQVQDMTDAAGKSEDAVLPLLRRIAAALEVDSADGRGK